MSLCPGCTASARPRPPPERRAVRRAPEETGAGEAFESHRPARRGRLRRRLGLGRRLLRPRERWLRCSDGEGNTQGRGGNAKEEIGDNDGAWRCL